MNGRLTDKKGIRQADMNLKISYNYIEVTLSCFILLTLISVFSVLIIKRIIIEN